MKRYQISYSGTDSVVIEANSLEEAEEILRDDAPLYDLEIDDTKELENNETAYYNGCKLEQ